MKRYKKIILFSLLVLGLAYHFYCPYKLQFLGHYNKVYAHRVNSKEKLNSAVNFYNGVELDLIYLPEKDVLDVNHYPVTSIGLTFEAYFKSIPKYKNIKLWLDIKNLDTTNASLILKRLKTIVSTCSFNTILVESRNADALEIFTKAGFKTSYYIDPKIKSMDSEELRLVKIKMDSLIAKYPKIGLSSNYLDYNFLSNNFPNQEHYFWVLNSDFNSDFFKIRKLLNDANVKIVLCRYRALQGNR